MSQTGWSGQDAETGTAYTTNPVVTSSTLATHTYQVPALAAGATYYWRAYAVSSDGSYTLSNPTAIRSFLTSAPPAAPTLIRPSAGADAQNSDPVFQLRATDANSDPLRYRIEVCAVSDCTSIVRTIDQTLSQTGWSLQDANAGTAYISAPSLTASSVAVHQYQLPFLTVSTQYWWRAYAIDPGDSNSWSPASTISSFTTGTNAVRVQGGLRIMGGTKVGN